MSAPEMKCPACGDDFIIDLPPAPPYDAPHAGQCDNCGYQDYIEAFEVTL